MPSKNLEPALWGGVFIGVFSALPIVKYGNCACCMWVVIGGVIAAYLLQKASPLAISVGDGAFVGLVAGSSGAVIGAVLASVINLIVSPVELEVVRRFAEDNPDMPPWLHDALANRGARALAGLRIFGFIMGLCFYTLFGAIGGMIGAAIFNRGKATSVQPPPSPPAA